MEKNHREAREQSALFGDWSRLHCPAGEQRGLELPYLTRVELHHGRRSGADQSAIHVVVDASGVEQFNDLTNNGFTYQGTPCNTFVNPPAAGNDACPLSVRVTWSAICGTPCTGFTAKAQITIMPVYNPSNATASRLAFNPANYDSVFLQGAGNGSDCWVYNGVNLYDRCSGNVGLGTTNPTSKLDVRDNSNATLAVTNSSNGSVIRLISAGNASMIGTASGHNLTLMSGGGGRMVLGSGGGIGVGGGPLGGFLFYVYGNVGFSDIYSGGSFVCNSTGCVSSSDRRLKEDIQPLDHSLEKVLTLEGVRYSFIDKHRFGDGKHVGFIAQDVEKVFPEVVVTDASTGFKSLAYGHLIAPLVEAVKSIYQNLKFQDEEVRNLREQVRTLEKRLELLEGKTKKTKFGVKQ